MQKSLELDQNPEVLQQAMQIEGFKRPDLFITDF